MYIEKGEWQKCLDTAEQQVRLWWPISDIHIYPKPIVSKLKGKQYTFGLRQLCQRCFTCSLKRFYPKRKEFAPLGSKFFPFRVEPFSEADGCAGEQTGRHKHCLFYEKIAESPQCVSSLFSSGIVPSPIKEHIAGLLAKPIKSIITYNFVPNL